MSNPSPAALSFSFSVTLESHFTFQRLSLCLEKVVNCSNWQSAVVKTKWDDAFKCSSP